MAHFSNPNRYVLAGLGAVGLFTLSACNDPVPGQPPAATPSTSASTTSAPTSSAPARRPAGGTAAPNTNFRLGEAAKVPFTFGYRSGFLSLTVTAIEKGSPIDLASFPIKDKVAGMVPYYIRLTITNSGQTDLSLSTNNRFSGVLGNGSMAQGKTVLGPFPKCNWAAAPTGFTPGKSYQACVITLASPTDAVTAAAYWGDPYGYKGALRWK